MSKLGNNPNSLGKEIVKKKNNCGKSVQQNAIQQNKRKNYWYTITTWMELKGIILHEKKKPISKDYILSASIYIIFLKWQNYTDGEQISNHQGDRSRGGCNYTGVAQERSLWWQNSSVSWLWWWFHESESTYVIKLFKHTQTQTCTHTLHW